MSIETLKNEIEKISLSPEQRKTVNNHFIKVEGMLHRLKHSDIRKQGSFGRGTVIRGQEGNGYDLDIAVVVNDKNPLAANILNQQIYQGLREEYNGSTQDVTIGKKAVQAKIKNSFGIDVTQIYKNEDQELVYNSLSGSFEPSYALMFREMFRRYNFKSNDSLRDVARIFKHIRDAIKDFEFKSIALEMMLYYAFKAYKTISPSRISSDNYAQRMVEILRNFEILWTKKIQNGSFNSIENPANESDFIPTGITNIDDANKILTLNTLVIKTIEGAVVSDRKFSHLERKFRTLEELNREYETISTIAKGKTVITGGTFGGDFLNKNNGK